MKRAVASGALASAFLWGLDFARLPRYELAQEAKLVAVHVAVGMIFGGLVALSFRDRLAARRLAVLSAAFTLAVGVLGLLAMVGYYPQLFADRWWLRGGVLATIQFLATHTIGPRAFDALAIALIASVSIASLARLVRDRRRHLGKLAAAAIAVVALRQGLPANADVIDRPPNVLIVASDSLRTGDVEDAATMPFLASRLPEGSLYRYAVSSIARTYPALVSTVTGREPRGHGVRHSYPSVEARRNVGPTLFTELRDGGYFTFTAGDAAGGVLTGFAAGFESVAAPRLDMASLDRGAILHRHRFSLSLLRFRLFRALFPEWRNVPFLADPDWVVDDAIRLMERARERPFAGLVSLTTARRPYLAPHPHYESADTAYRGRYLYHHSPLPPPTPPSADDIEQIRERYVGALTAIDRALERLLSRVGVHTLVVVTGARGETPGLAEPFDTVRSLDTQAVPVVLLGRGVPDGVRSDRQVRQYDLPATVLDLLGRARSFGDGVSLLDADALRPVCVETGIWREPGNRSNRLDYPGVSRLVAIDPESDELVLRSDVERLVESVKERGVILDHRLYREQMTSRGLERQTMALDGPAPANGPVDLAELFDERCVDGDPLLSRLYGAVVFERRAP